MVYAPDSPRLNRIPGQALKPSNDGMENTVHGVTILKRFIQFLIDRSEKKKGPEGVRAFIKNGRGEPI
jgi:hypothetical protein